MNMRPVNLFVFLAASAAASKPVLHSLHTFTGLATFNDFRRQGNTNCGPKSEGARGTYGAAAGDISPDISGGKCRGSINLSICRGKQSPPPGYKPPGCPKGNCGLCYKVTNKGGQRGAKVNGVGNSIIFQIIDSCPATNAQNFCKTKIPADERCGSSSTNQLDIDLSAYKAFTGQDYHASGHPNLIVKISVTACP